MGVYDQMIKRAPESQGPDPLTPVPLLLKPGKGKGSGKSK